MSWKIRYSGYKRGEDFIVNFSLIQDVNIWLKMWEKAEKFRIIMFQNIKKMWDMEKGRVGPITRVHCVHCWGYRKNMTSNSKEPSCETSHPTESALAGL